MCVLCVSPTYSGFFGLLFAGSLLAEEIGGDLTLFMFLSEGVGGFGLAARLTGVDSMALTLTNCGLQS